MVNFALFFAMVFSLLISQNVIAAPYTAGRTAVANAPRDTQGRFSFADWVDTIIADPETALKPKEAVQAFMNSMNATQSANSSSSSNGLEKRWDSKTSCNYTWDSVVFEPAQVTSPPATPFLFFSSYSCSPFIRN